MAGKVSEMPDAVTLVDAHLFEVVQLEQTGPNRKLTWAALKAAVNALIATAVGAVDRTQAIIIAASDETTALTTGTAKITFRMPYGFTLSAVRASLTTAQTSGAILTIDVNENGTSILSTKLTIDNTEKTSTTAATAAVISDANLGSDSEITIDIDQVGDSTAKGLKVTLIGVKV